ncbi:GNAT family N-acetyltransferase [Rubrobacter tropicus]|uniref:GNAT family N-acetyltransferase n=1 Tax=Rubrobacter tropicus TaxID=2653851 RepID=A0A6G8Q4L6_9ACTN|nr:GNAT family N-acetyltransferase [Rubrobacter tropicus]QIN81406.1 GNAT family N-acetyltransferase [Rubrobacter tropicus]
MIVRDYREHDAGEICRLFYGTVRAVNLGDYSPEQVRAWAPAPPDPDLWHERMSGRHTLVVGGDDGVVGFAELEEDGHLDMFYCRWDVVGRGVGSLLYAAVEERARELGVGRIFTEASITARPFFERKGFSVLRRNTVARGGVELTNFSMEKVLGP